MTQSITYFTAVILLLLILFLPCSKYSPLLFLALCISLLLVCRIPILSYPDPNKDECVFYAGLRLIESDLRIWFSFDPYTAGPLNSYFLLLMKNLMPTFSISYMRLTGLLVIYIPIVILTYYSSYFLSGKLSAQFTTLIFTILLSFSNNTDFLIFTSELIPGLLVSILLCLLSLLIKKGNPSIFYYMCFLAGFAPYTKLQVIPIVFAIIIIGGFQYYKKEKAKYLSASIVLGILPTILLVFYLFKFDLLQDFWQSYIQFNLDYGNDSLYNFWLRPLMIYLHSDNIRFPLALISVILLFGIFFRIKNGSQSTAMWYVLVLILACFYSLAKPGPTYPHYLILVIAPILWSIAYLYKDCPQTLQHQKHLKFCLVFVFIFMMSRSLPKFNHDFSIDQFSAKLATLAQPGDRLTYWGIGQYKYIFIATPVISGTRDVFTKRQILPSKHQQYFLDRFQKDFLKNQPKFILEEFYTDPTYAKLSTVLPQILTEYHVVMKMDNSKLYMKNL